MNITQKDLDRVKKRCLESLGDFLSELCRDKLMGPTSVEKIFSFDHTTFKRICEKDQTITVKTMARTMGIIASFLNGLKETCDKELKNLQEDDKMKLSLKRKKIDVLNKKRMKCTEAMEKYKKTADPNDLLRDKKPASDSAFQSSGETKSVHIHPTDPNAAPTHISTTLDSK